jgi:hypothetical protein
VIKYDISIYFTIFVIKAHVNKKKQVLSKIFYV